MTEKSIYSDLTLLGGSSNVPSNPDEAVIEKVNNPKAGSLYSVRFTVPEFTSLCPLTGQPDFAHLVIDYVPDKWLVESKSLKLYLGSFRNHGAFHEDCTVSIALNLKKPFVAYLVKNWRLLVPTWGDTNRYILPNR
jgi:7-cyano-7-deazaguanine reductase